MALTEKQLAARKVGGSSVATILGLNPYKTALELFMEDTKAIAPVDISEVESVEAGNVMEDGIATLTQIRMSRRLGREIKLRRSNVTIVNPKYEWLTAHIDRDVVGEERGVEIKNVGWRMASKWGPEDSGEIPEYYRPQVHAYMLVKDYPVWTVSAYLGGGELKLYEIERSPAWDEIIIEATHSYWFDHVLKGIPPPINPNAPNMVAALKRVYPGTNGMTVSDETLRSWRDVRIEAKAQIARYEKVVDGCDAHLLDAMKEAAVLQFDDGSAFTRKLIKRKEMVIAATQYIDFRYKAAKSE